VQPVAALGQEAGDPLARGTLGQARGRGRLPQRRGRLLQQQPSRRRARPAGRGVERRQRGRSARCGAVDWTEKVFVRPRMGTSQEEGISAKDRLVLMVQHAQLVSMKSLFNAPLY